MRDGRIEQLNEIVSRSPFHRWLGCRVTAFDPTSGILELTLPLREELRRDAGDDVAHGGVIATIIDIAGHAALQAQTGFGLRTIGMRVDYLRAALSPLTALARPISVGKSVGFVDVEVFDRERTSVGLGRVVFSTRPPAVEPRE